MYSEVKDMNIGVPKEVKTHEYRVAATPGTVHGLVAHGHQVMVQTGAGVGSGFSDDEYRAQGATLVGSAGRGVGRNRWS